MLNASTLSTVTLLHQGQSIVLKGSQKALFSSMVVFGEHFPKNLFVRSSGALFQVTLTPDDSMISQDIGLEYDFHEFVASMDWHDIEDADHAHLTGFSPKEQKNMFATSNIRGDLIANLLSKLTARIQTIHKKHFGKPYVSVSNLTVFGRNVPVWYDLN